jgi:hypothetical protein
MNRLSDEWQKLRRILMMRSGPKNVTFAEAAFCVVVLGACVWAVAVRWM